MAFPTLTVEQRDLLRKKKQELTETLTALNNQLTENPIKQNELEKNDLAYKAQFDYYDTNLVGAYDTELRNVNGTYVTSPITEANLKDVAEDLNRSNPLYPPLGGSWDIVRVPEFDGGNTSTDLNNELTNITRQAEIEDVLVNGKSNTPTLTGTTVTASNLTASSTTLNISDPDAVCSFSAGNYFVVTGSGTAAMVEVLTATNTNPAPAPTAWSLGIRVVVAPSGTISSGAATSTFTTGFSNADRTSKTTSQQALMDACIAMLEFYLNRRLTNVENQLTSLNLNEDEQMRSELNAAIAEAEDTETFIDTYLLTTVISNTGISTLSTERGTRTTFLNARATEILASYAGNPINYYDKRYIWANMRANLFNGTLRLLKVLEESEDTLDQMIENTEQALEALEDLI
jgi:hypothetical protein